MSNSDSAFEQAPNSTVSPRLKIAALWISTFFIFAYVDIFSLMRADFIETVLDGQISVFTVGQSFLFYTTLYIIIPSVMIFLTLVLPPKINRWANLILAVIYIITIIGGCIGETWIYYLFGSAVEVILLSTLVWYAWKLPH